MGLGLALCGSAMADHIYTTAQWKGWKVSTGEEVWYKPRHSSYPIWNMFDGDQRTAWVYSGGFSDPDSDQPKLRSIRDRYWIQLTADKPTRISEVRLMNGYNKDSSTFGRNARILKVDLFEGDSAGAYSAERKKIGSYRLRDQMGFQTIKIPARRYNGLRIEVTDIARGTDPDVAISELALYDGARNVSPKAPKHLIYTPGDSCGCGGEERLMTADQKVLARSGEMASLIPSPSDRYFTGWTSDFTKKKTALWVYDTVLNKKVWTRWYGLDRQPFVEFDARNRLRQFDYADRGTEKKVLKAVLWKP